MFKTNSLWNRKKTFKRVMSAGRRLSFRPTLRELEHRLAPAIFTVVNTNDSGTGSLRAAITSANNSSGADSITFSLTLPATITLASALPQITDGLTIDGPGPNNLTISGDLKFPVFSTATGQALT